MPRSEIPFHPGATQDYEEAYVWYFGHSIDLAAEFEREIDRGLRLIAGNPLRWPKFDAEPEQGVKSALGSLRLIREKVGSEEGILYLDQPRTIQNRQPAS